MKNYRLVPPHHGFTLVELLVVVSIIALLIGILLPAMSSIRAQAKNVQATAQLAALERGIEQFRGEADLGGAYPPSAGDYPDYPRLIANPLDDAPGDPPSMAITGAHLLVHALVGADLLGTPGFRDLDGDGFWADDTHMGDGGAYEIDDTTGEEMQVRYGGAGYVSDKMREESIKSLNDLNEDGVIFNWTDSASTTDTRRQPLFVDPWDRPILYYKANPTSRRMIAAAGAPGIYWQDDNAVITGCVNGVDDYGGIDFGAGEIDGSYHRIADAVSPEPMEDMTADLSQYERSFAYFIWDRSIRVRNTPTRKDSYLLISAGPDAIYGSEDDVTNWTRQVD